MTVATLPEVARIPRPPRPSRHELHAVTIPASAHSLDGFRAWVHSGLLPASCRVTFIRGEVTIDMSPEKIGSHNAVKMEVSATLYRFVREREFGRFFPDGTLVSNRDANISNEPDAIFVSAESFARGRARVVPSADGRDFVHVEGSPDLILEVVSPSSVTKDTVTLREGYLQAGVTEYWLIDARGEEIRFDILRHAEAEYQPTAAEDGWLLSKVFGAKFRLDRILDSFGIWVYTLHVAPIDPVAK